jgi:hypothetical protein
MLRKYKFFVGCSRGFKSSRQPAKIAACDPPNRWVLKKKKNIFLILFFGAWWILGW